MELPEACAAIAAAGLLAVARGGAAFGDLDDGVIELARSEGVSDDSGLRDLALAALARLNGASSEWRELWSESGSPAEADEMVVGLRSMLA
jgi:hypothetical protein